MSETEFSLHHVNSSTSSSLPAHALLRARTYGRESK
jgi:hypothetical protein